LKQRDKREDTLGCELQAVARFFFDGNKVAGKEAFGGFFNIVVKINMGC
jgi:hypothetical protein